ncbi:putative enoyl-CoA hydratase echA8 [Enhygromyxa salina]|uniref:Putative enoyl-CoA hydratase echA8 n=1 Tax=Enhygromyxa salina TaxID=215803 RepID=A0A2S9Y091_9BACT|nr:enoyl-CoA hydratase-related protein [Enhygromyxa salina]PRP98509.1 putative enoyl-CoA hydratase echA8 [Enhygromyxa salina]
MSPTQELPQHVRYAREGALATITLDRPEARNAYSDEMCAQLCSALDRADVDADVRCVILTGAGKSFHAGGDIKAMRARSGMFAGDPAELRARYMRGIQAVPRRISEFSKPLIAAINGAAIGAGLDLACMCDIRIARAGAKLGSTFVKVGLVPGDGGAYFLTRVVGFSRALELCLTGRVIEAEEAHAIGLVHEVVAAEELLEVARARAEAIAANPPVAVQLTKRAAYRSYHADQATALELAASFQGIAQNHDDHARALAKP